MKNGLSYFEEGGVAGGVSKAPVAPNIIPPTGAAAKKVPLDPTQTADLLANMQEMINSRQGPMASFNRGLERAAAWGSGGIQGPSEALNRLNTQQQAEEKSTFEMRQQMAAYKAAQEQAKRSSGYYGLPGYGAQAGEQAGAVPADRAPLFEQIINRLPLNMQPQARRMALSNDIPGFEAIVKEAELKRPDLQKNLEFAGNQPGNTGEIIKRSLLKEGYAPQVEIGPNGEKYEFTVPGAGSVPLAPTPKPATGAVDLKQVALNAGIPADAIISDYRDPAKQLSLIDREDPNKPGRYLTAQGKPVALPGQSAHQVPGAAIDIKPSYELKPAQKQALIQAGAVEIPGDPGHYQLPISKIRAETAFNDSPTIAPVQRKSINQLETEKAGSLESAKEIGKEIGKIGAEIRTLGRTSGERETRYNDILSLTQDPTMKDVFGKLSKNGFMPFVLKSIETGVGIGQFGTIGIPDLEKNLTIAGATPTQIEKFKRVEKHLKQAELEYSRVYLQGQGAVSDNERRIVQQATGSISDPAKILQMQAGVMRQRAIFDKKMSDALDQYRDKNGTYADVDAFLRGPGKSVIAEHNKELSRILGVNVPLNNNPLQASPEENTSTTTGKSAPLKNVPFKVIK